ncbi:MAG TPA: hypothetical protein PKW80_04545 [Bacteroidales bacterium]|nr:hypothetical protein [Bacteroidales bacterium]
MYLIGNAQVCDFFNKSGYKTLAKCAHPSNKFLKGKCALSGNIVTVDVFYTDGDHSIFSLKNSGYLFTQVTTKSDISNVKPFLAFNTIKNTFANLCNGLSNNSKNIVVAALEKALGYTLKKFSAEDYTLLALSIQYYRYQKKL